MSEASGPHSTPPSLSQIHQAFLIYLEQVERRNWEGNRFYNPTDIKKWMEETTIGASYSNVVRLVSAVFDHDHFPIEAREIEDYQLVFAVLLHPDVNCGNLIHIFKQCNISDSNLPIFSLSHFYKSVVQDLEEVSPPLPSNYKHHDYAAVISAFERVRWAFCPANLELNMRTSFYRPCILPFFHGEVINQKGGTANVRHYKIQEDLIMSNKLREALASSRHKDPKFGWCYEFVVKSYIAGWEDIYKLESEAFKGVRGHTGVVQYLGEYHFREGGSTSPNHNIILEYGQQDLDEYLADTYPPVLTTEIIAFWEGLFKVAATLERLHQLEFRTEDGKIRRFKGWHGDIKPDNILRVRGEYKLADFGFTQFEKDEIGKSRTSLLGGTQTYGAPECDVGRYGTSTPHLQTIDTWSFGCVLSAVATWVILGSQAYDNYRQVRILAISELHQRSGNNQRGSIPSCDDAFHDGSKVLPAVRRWHNFLRNSSRRADTISSRVLDLIDDKMLLEAPGDRLTLEQLCARLDDILILAREEHRRSLEKGSLLKVESDTLEALLKLDERAPAMATSTFQSQNAVRYPENNHGPSFLSPNGQGSSRLRPLSDRVRKSERLEKIILGKTANREETIRSDLSRATEGGGLCESPLQVPADAEHHTSGTQITTKSVLHVSTLSGKGKEVDVPEIHLENVSPVIARAQNSVLASSDERPLPSDKIQQPHPNSVPPDKPTTSNALYEKQTIKPEPCDGRAYVEARKDFPQPQTPPTFAFPPDPQMSSATNNEHDVIRTPVAISRSSELPAIFVEYTRLEKLWGDKKGPFSTLLGKIPEDPWLKNFISNRDIIFIVDNAVTMRQHWDVVTTTLVTLAMKIGSLDKDGLDLIYTIGTAHNLRGAKAWDIPKAFRNSMHNARQEIDERYMTNMGETLRRIFDDYNNFHKKMTLIILTDGLWEGLAKKDDVEKLVAGFITDLYGKLKKWESRWFSIQFVSFGNDQNALARLEKLDDDMPIEEDVIDAKPWSHWNVDKLILGSMTDDGDKDAASPPLLSPDSPSPDFAPAASSASLQIPGRAFTSRSEDSSSFQKRRHRLSKISRIFR